MDVHIWVGVCSNRECQWQAVSPCSHLCVSCSVLTKQLSGRKFSTLSSVLVDNLLATVGPSKATSIPHSLQGFRFPGSELVLSLLLRVKHQTVSLSRLLMSTWTRTFMTAIIDFQRSSIKYRPFITQTVIFIFLSAILCFKCNYTTLFIATNGSFI